MACDPSIMTNARKQRKMFKLYINTFKACF